MRFSAVTEGVQPPGVLLGRVPRSAGAGGGVAPLVLGVAAGAVEPGTLPCVPLPAGGVGGAFGLVEAGAPL